MTVLIAACGGGDGGSSSASDLVETADTAETVGTADATGTASFRPMAYEDVFTEVNDAESDLRALLLLEAAEGATEDDAALLDAAIVEALSSAPTDFARPLGQSVVAGPMMMQSTAMIGATLGLPFRFQDMGTSGRSEEPSPAEGGVRKVITVEGSRLTMELGVSVTESSDGVTYTDEATGKATADVCPDSNGTVTIDIEIQERASQAGFTARASLTARATATVGDDAEVQSFSVDTRIGFDAQRPDGVNGFVEYESTIVPGGRPWERTSDRVSRDRHGDLLKNAPKLRDKVENLAGFAAVMVLNGAKDRWQSGFCVEVQAQVPAKVRPGSATTVEVHVRQRFEGVELEAPVEVALSGEKSVEPKRIERAPGTITYTAPPEKDKYASLTFTSTSRRGIGKLTAGVSTGGDSYHAVGGADDFLGEGDICDVSKPFTISGGGVVVQFTPSSASGGSYTYGGSLEGFAVSGGGTYRVQLSGDGGTITASGQGSVETPVGVMSAGGEEVYTLTTIEACDS